MKLTWRCVLKIVGLALALAGLICLLAGYWDKLLAGGCVCKEALSKKCRAAARSLTTTTMTCSMSNHSGT